MEKKRNIVEWAMHYRHIVILITCILFAFGIVGLAKMNKNEFPDFTIRQGIVAAVYPGATASEVEEQVTKPLEDYIFSYKEVKKAKTKSVSKQGMAIIQVELNDDISDKDAFWTKFKHGINTFRASLPGGVLAVQVNDDFGDTSSLLITMESTDKTYRELNGYMTALKDSLRKIETVGRMTVQGLHKEQISVRLDNRKLSQYGISDQYVAYQLMQKGYVATAGTLKGPRTEVPVFVQRSMNMVRDVEDMIVYSDPMGNNIRLKDVAEVAREYPELTSQITTNGRKCILLSVEIKKGRSITEMGDAIKRKMSDFRRTLPEDVTITTITDQSQVVGDSVANFLKELLIAVVAVIIVVLLLMPLRVALVAASTIPITIFISLGLFYAFGIELNTVSLAALIVTLGMIVDNSIVIIDSYVENLAEGKPRWQASIDSANHFFHSVLSATLAISVTFFPFLLVMSGTFRDFLLTFPWAVSIVLLVSLAVAMLLVPFLQFWFIRDGGGKGSREAAHGKRSFLERLQEKYDRLVAVCFRHPYATLGVGTLSVAVGVLMMVFLPKRLMPYADRNQFAVEIYLPEGATLARTAAVADSMEHILRQDRRVVSVASFKGCSSPRFQAGYAPQLASEAYAQFIVNTPDAKTTVRLIDEYRDKYVDFFPDARVKFKRLQYGEENNTIELRLSGDDWTALRHDADSLADMLRVQPYLTMVRNDVGGQLLTQRIVIDEDEASRLGVSNQALQQTLALRYYGDGMTVATVWDGDYGTDVKIKGSKADRADIGDLLSEQIPCMGGRATVPLRQIAKVVPTWQDAGISHRNGMRTVTIMADVKNGMNGMNATAKVQKLLKGYHPAEGVSASWGGEHEISGENTPKMMGGLGIAVVIIFFILLAHFRRIPTAVLILCSLSLCLFGTAMGVFLGGIDFSLTCYLGIISLMGILVRNAIIMFDYAEELRESGRLKAKDAIFNSAKRRMRPIFLTSAAASMGVIPMILGGSGLWKPMGSVIFWGTLITMTLILTVLPVAYWLTMSGSTKRRQASEEIEKM